MISPILMFALDLAVGQALQARGRLKRHLAQVLSEPALEADGVLDDLAGLTREHAAFAERRHRAEINELIDLVELSLTWKLD